MIDASTRPPDAIRLPGSNELDALFPIKYGPPDTVGWSPRLRRQFGYYLPADVYEGLVDSLVRPGSTWLDVGGGHDIFPDNPRLAAALVERAAHLTVVDPSDNVHDNRFTDDRVQSMLEDFATDRTYDLATMRMVVEHVATPESFVAALARLVKPGGHAVVFTINRHSPLSWLSWLLPFQWHHPLKKLFWGSDEKDTFPVCYRMNTRAELAQLFAQAGFEERMFSRLADLSTLGQFKAGSYIELLAWRSLAALGIVYPENCLLGVYRRR